MTPEQENELRKWAADWVGWFYDEDDIDVYEIVSLPIDITPIQRPASRSEADLAEAVRVKAWSIFGMDLMNCLRGSWIGACVHGYGCSGPLAFIAAVKGLIDE